VRRRRNLLLGVVLALALTGCDVTEEPGQTDPDPPGQEAPGDDAPGEPGDPGGTGS